MWITAWDVGIFFIVEEGGTNIQAASHAQDANLDKKRPIAQDAQIYPFMTSVKLCQPPPLCFIILSWFYLSEGSSLGSSTCEPNN